MDRFEAQSFLNQLIHYILYDPLVRATDFYHPDFIGQHHLESFNLDVLIERFDYFSLQRSARGHFEKILKLVNQETQKDIQLTAREIDCLYYYVSGLSSKESAKKVGGSYRTLDKHLENIKLKYQLSSVRDLKNMFQLI